MMRMRDRLFTGERAWMNDANCRGLPPRAFHPPKHENTSALIARAVAVCEGCQVRGDCLEYNLANYTSTEDDGIWGGKTVGQRNKMRKVRRLL